MARIAEDLLLLLLDNASERPGLDRARRERVLAAALLLDLAHSCRVRPAVDGEPAPAGRLVVLAGPDPDDPLLVPALHRLARRPVSPQTAIAKVRRGVEPALLKRLELSGQIRPIRLRGAGFNRQWKFPLTDRLRVDQARADLLSALFDDHRPSPSTAAIISLLHRVDGLGPLLSLNDRGWQWVHARAGEIAGGSWVDEQPNRPPEVNLAVTVAAIAPALA